MSDHTLQPLFVWFGEGLKAHVIILWALDQRLQHLLVEHTWLSSGRSDFNPISVEGEKCRRESNQQRVIQPVWIFTQRIDQLGPGLLIAQIVHIQLPDLVTVV